MNTSNRAFEARLFETTCDAQVVAAAELDRVAAFAAADGSVLLVDETFEATRVAAQANVTVLVAAAAGRRLATGGDDGLVAAFDAEGRRHVIADENGKWIDALAMRADGAVGWSVGKEVKARDARGDVKTLTAPSSVRGLCFLPKGYRLALACYNGVLLWFPNVATQPETLEWRGSHLGVTVSPDGRFVVSAMQENALHGWRIADRRNMRMTGYPGKTRSFSWSADGNWLATSGAEACIVWPFAGKDGPMGKAPEELGVRPRRVTQAAFHPTEAVVAIGYDDGWIVLCRMADGEEAAIRAPSQDDRTEAITALAWSARGDRLLYGTNAGAAGVATVSLTRC